MKYKEETSYLDLVKRAFKGTSGVLAKTSIRRLDKAELEFDINNKRVIIPSTRDYNYDADLKELRWFLSGNNDIETMMEAGLYHWERWVKDKVRHEDKNYGLEMLRKKGILEYKHIPRDFWINHNEIAFYTALEDLTGIKLVGLIKGGKIAVDVGDLFTLNKDSVEGLYPQVWHVSPLEDMPSPTVLKYFTSGSYTVLELENVELLTVLPKILLQFSVLTHMQERPKLIRVLIKDGFVLADNEELFTDVQLVRMPIPALTPVVDLNSFIIKGYGTEHDDIDYQIHRHRY